MIAVEVRQIDDVDIGGRNLQRFERGLRPAGRGAPRLAKADIGDDMHPVAFDIGNIQAAGGRLTGERGVDLGL